MRQIRPALLPVVLAVLVVTATATVAVAAANTETQGSVPGAAELERPGTGAASANDALLVVRELSNTTNYLDVEQDDVERGEFGDGSLDAAGAVGMDVQRLRGEYARRSFDAEYGDGTADEANARIAAEVDRLESRIQALERRQREAIDAYNAGDRSTEQFLRELATIDVAATAVGDQFDHLQGSTTITRSDDVYSRIENLRARLVPLQGPVRERTAAAMTGESPPASVYVVTSSAANVLSLADGQRLVREAHMPENRELTGEDTFVTEDEPNGAVPAINRAGEVYPWAYDNLDSGPSLEGYGQTSVYSVTIGHPHGTLETFLDGTTREVFREIQSLRMNRLPTETTGNATSSMALRVNRTYGTGPMQVTVTDPTTGEPMNATILVNDHRVGATGDDGRLWTPTPHRQVRLRAVTEEGSVRLVFFAD